MNRYILTGLLLMLPLAASCKDSNPSAAAGKPDGVYKIVVTTGMIGDIVGKVAGERGKVTTLMGAGVDPHLYKPTRSDIALLNAADLVFYNGLLLEGKLTDALVRVAGAGKKVVAVTEQIDPSYLLEPEEFAGHHDPHVWMDPQAWIKAVLAVKQSLTEFDPAHAAQYAANASNYLKELEELDRYAESSIAGLPENSRVLVTAHDAFNYFGRRYKLSVVGIQGISTESEAGVKDIEQIVELLVSKQVAAVFVESSVPQRNVQALVEGAAARGHKVKIGGELFSDAMGRRDTYEGTYLGMIDHNVTTIVRALGGTVPERGMRGLLAPHTPAAAEG